jgi:GT2 family glycosyltransferase
MALLEVFIPTYNRVDQLDACLASLVKAVKYLPLAERSKVGIVVRSNATKNLTLKHSLIEKNANLFNDLGVAYFDFIITGFNIGMANSLTGGMFSSKSNYLWILPDDDIARFDSLSIALFTILTYSPCFIEAAIERKVCIDYYSDESGEDDGIPNTILDCIYDRDKV